MSASTDMGPIESLLSESPLAKPAAVRMLAAVVFGATLIQALSEPLAAWNHPEVWPRYGAMPRLGYLALVAVGFALQALAIVLARRRPTAGTVAAFALYLALALGLDSPTWLSSANLAVAVTMFFVALQGSHVRTFILLVATMAVFWAMQWFWAARLVHAPAAQWWPYLLHVSVLFAPLVIAGGVLGGLWGAQARRVAAARAEAEAARHEHEQRVARAREAERERIAQELHDVAAQHLAGLLSLADAAVDLAEEDPRTAMDLITDARAEGRFAVASIYGALGELRSREAAHVAPTPDATQVADLVQQWRSRGMLVELFALGDLAGLPAVVSVTAYRVVQESLTNAAKHAPGAPVQVRLLADVARLGVLVENAPPIRPSSSAGDGIGLGWGLSGLRDRLTLLNGTLRAERTTSGGWRVSADLPLTQPETTGRAAQWTP